MGYLGGVDLGSAFQPFTTFRERFGFVPNLFRAQASLPRLIEAEAALVSAILFSDRALARAQKECILLALAAARGNAYCFGLHFQILRLLGVTEQRLDRIVAGYQQAELTPANRALLKFALRLGTSDAPISREDVSEALSCGLTNEAVMEAVLTAALSALLCSLSNGVGAEPDFTLRATPLPLQDPPVPSVADGSPGLYLPAPELSPDDFAPFAFLRDQFGSVHNVFRAQTSRPDVLEAEAYALRLVLTPEDGLARAHKEGILLATSPGADPALQHFVDRLLANKPEFSRTDIQILQTHGFTEPQILETVVTASLASFFNVLETGLGVGLRFAARRNAKKAHLSSSNQRPTDVPLPVDPDAECVARVQSGDLNSFEELMNRHSQRVYRTLVGILGNPDEARDALQETFMKAFENLPGFQGRSKFSTWLVSIATNTGIQHLRERRPMESLDETGNDEEGFHPRQVQAWTDDPEQLYSRSQMRSLIEDGVMRLPGKYRVVLMLRDIEQLPIEEAASALGLGIPAIKARLLRGRLMLREALAPHFISSESKRSAKGVAV